MFILANKASILLHLINKNHDTGQTSILFFKGREYLLTSLKALENEKNVDSQDTVIQLFEGELQRGLKIQSDGIFLDFNAYREFMTINPNFNRLLFLQIKKKNELEIWKNELSSDSKIIPVVSELRTDWLRNVFVERLPVMFEVSTEFDFPEFIPGYILIKSKKKKASELTEIRKSLRTNQQQMLMLLAERREMISKLNIIKKEKEIPVFQEDVYLSNLLNCFFDSKQMKLPLSDCLDLYMLLHSLSVKQQEESRK